MQPPASPDPNGAATGSLPSPSAPDGSGLPAQLPSLPGGSFIPPPQPMDPNQAQAVPPPVITDASNITRRPDAADIKNPFERVATLLVDMSYDQAGRLAASLSEQPADTLQPDPSTVHEMMNFSPYGTDAPRVFWQVHDQLLQDAANNQDPDPYAVAERGALDQVYPYRAKLALLDVLAPDQKVARAEELMRISNQQTAKGRTPESLPTNVSPTGLSASDASLPAPSSNGRVNGGPY